MDLRPLKFCLYLLPLSAILMFNKIGYHVNADDAQLYIYIYHLNVNSHWRLFQN